jgi:hypothetical protein
MSKKRRDRVHEQVNSPTAKEKRALFAALGWWDGGPELSPEEEKESLLYSKSLRARMSIWLSRRWFGVVVFFLTGAGAAVADSLALTRADFSSAQWAYSALFQSATALIGLAAVVATVMWQQSVASQAALQSLIPKYANMAFTTPPGEPPANTGGRSRVMILLGQLEQILDKPTRGGERVALEGTGLETRSDVLVALARWAYAGSWYTNIELPIPIIRAWFKKIGLSEVRVQELLVGSLVDRISPVSFFELQEKVFSPTNRVLTQLDPAPANNLVWEIVYEMLRDGALHHVRRGGAFTRMARGPLAAALFVYLLTILSAAAGMTVTNATWHSPSLLAASVGAGICSAGVTLGFVWHFTTQR